MPQNSPRLPAGAGRAFLKFLGISAAAAVLATVAVTPAIALTGVTARNSIDVFEDLPSYLAIPELAQKTNLYYTASDGSPQLLASFFDQDREVVGWDDVSQTAKDAATSAEDPRFYDHGAIDLQGTVRAAVSTVSGADLQGGSSITQQYVKNVLVEKAVLNAKTKAEKTAAVKAATETTLDRKVKEMRLAIGVEKKYTKDEILLGYLNIAFFGGRVYGIEAASEYYFNGTHAKDLTPDQSATLLAIVNNPTKFRLDQPNSKTNGAANGYAATKVRRDYILGNMLKEGKIDQATHDASIAAPISPVIKQPSTGCASAGDSAYFCDFVYWTMKNDPAFGKTAADRTALLQKGGLNIYTTLDPDMQATATTAMTDLVPGTSTKLDVGASAVSVEVGTGRVLEMVQNKKYSQDPEVLSSDKAYSAINYNTDFAYGGSSGFQTGSTYKPFTLAEWLKEGHSLNEVVDARRTTHWGNFPDSCLGPQGTPGYNPKNDEGGNGGFWTANYSTIHSENTGFLAMAKQLDLCKIKETAQDFGVHTATGADLDEKPSSVLGTNTIAPLTMANAYAAIAGNGVVCTPVVIDKIVKSDGSDMAPPAANCQQKVDPAITAGMDYSMQKVATQGTAVASYNRMSPKVPVIAKTGTTNNAEATWMTGSSSKVATAVGVFNATGHVSLRKTSFSGIQAALIRHTLWPRIQSEANKKYGGDDFPDPESSMLKTFSVTVPDVRGKSIDQARSLITAAGFGFADGGQQDSELPAGQVTGSDPSGNAPRGSLVTVHTSNGTLTQLPNAVGQKKDAAQATLSAFSVQFAETPVTDKNQDGVVISTDPAAGTAVKAGSNVTVTIGKYTKPGDGGDAVVPTPGAGDPGKDKGKDMGNGNGKLPGLGG